jgi:transcriptional regulator with XRE-family HTH domain
MSGSIRLRPEEVPHQCEVWYRVSDNFTIAAKFMIRKLRSKLGLSLRQGAESLGISESFLSQIENGKRKPSPDLLRAMAALLSCDLDELSLSVGQIPQWIESTLKESPNSAVKAARDRFKKYD